MYSITEEGFIQVKITPNMIQSATTKAGQLGILRNSIRKGKGNLVGFLGEEIVLAYFQQEFPQAVSLNTYDHDIKINGTTFEVKTKDRTVQPTLDYDASIAMYNTKQRADVLVFVSLYRPNKSDPTLYTEGFITGWIQKNDYFFGAKMFKVGDIDPSNGWKVKADCANRPYRELFQFGI